MTRLLTLITLVAFIHGSASAAVGDRQRFEILEHRLATDVAEEDEKRSEASEEKQKQLERCDEAYGVCLDKAIQNRKLCGSFDVCQERYKEDKGKCFSLSEACEKAALLIK